MNEVEEPPVGTTADTEVFEILNLFVDDVVIIPFVKSKFPFTSIFPLAPILNPELFDISR